MNPCLEGYASLNKQIKQDRKLRIIGLFLSVNGHVLSAMSAFAAVSTAIELNDSDENDEVTYQPFSSDDEAEMDQEFENFGIPPGTSLQDISNKQESVPVRTNPAITGSKFRPDDDNLVYGENEITVGLKNYEYLIIKGQYSLTIQRGAVEIDSVLFHASETPVKICSPSLTSLPMIASAQVTDRSLVNDQRTSENEHLFSSDYKSVLKISNWKTGLEGIGELYPPLKNILPLEIPSDFDPNSSHAVLGYSFEIVFADSGYTGVSLPKTWKTIRSELTEGVCEDRNPTRVFVLGTKNSGKSTFVRFLLNSITSNEQNVVILDLDPGQPEYSPSETISLTEQTVPIFGLNLKQFSQTLKTDECHYIGFSSPQRDPDTYLEAVSKLCLTYESRYASRNLPLLVNIPGWVKGFGVKLLERLSQLINPTHTVYLHSSSSELDRELDDVSFGKMMKAPGIFAPAGYSASQRRHFNTLAYLHTLGGCKFNMSPLITSPPYSISYSTSLAGAGLYDQKLGAIGVLDGAGLNHEDLQLCIEATVVGLYSVSLEEFASLIPTMVQTHASFPNYLNDTSQLYTNAHTLKFLGLGLVHSMDTDRKLLNIYTPVAAKTLSSPETKIVIIRGRSEVPVQEIAPRDVVLKYNKKRKKAKSENLGLPYISLSRTEGKGVKSLNVRRNIVRRR
ncbi:unnamed protein product [Kuraishia capsulata CBS 1993]|uniref:Polynucleotide 5'-hydroxyl-kinase GRC3 n=1 Tax=Kuraishia capsulata CBS 1993 TaxID=1382522 RepID=W6MTL1_9ASCO|nr:uncharacterized protein KUCA_T00004505001 [Kuraishia capsulata CBS 1993]CDK28522.1 unnamed protein product [Kuraishia capsulata CBS 1993]